MAKRCVTKVMAERYCFNKIFIQTERSRDSSCKTAYLQRVCEACTVMVTFRTEENLRFMFEASEGLGMGNTVDISLETGADGAFLFFNTAAVGCVCENTIGTDQNMFQFFPFFSGTGHCSTPSFHYQPVELCFLNILYGTKNKITFFYLKIFLTFTSYSCQCDRSVILYLIEYGHK